MNTVNNAVVFNCNVHLLEDAEYTKDRNGVWHAYQDGQLVEVLPDTLQYAARNLGRNK